MERCISKISETIEKQLKTILANFTQTNTALSKSLLYSKLEESFVESRIILNWIKRRAISQWYFQHLCSNAENSRNLSQFSGKSFAADKGSKSRTHAKCRVIACPVNSRNAETRRGGRAWQDALQPRR